MQPDHFSARVSRRIPKKDVIQIHKKDKKNKIVLSFCSEPAAEDVTGSMIYLKTKNHKILIDAGLHQSNDKYSDYLVNARKTKDFKPKEIDLIFLTHNHADHCLLAPRLYKEGCRAKTIIPKDSTGVLTQMALDCAKINDRDVLQINSLTGRNYQSLYGETDVAEFIGHTIEFPEFEKIALDEEISFQFIPAGHLLCSAQLLLYIKEGTHTTTLLFTGDLGNSKIKNHFVGEFSPVKHADYVIGESTYGDRPDIKTGKKERKSDLDKLKTIIDTQVKEMHGRVLIPSFAQSRAQALVTMIYELYKDDPSFTYKVYVDSPLAIKIFEEYANVLQGDELELFNRVLAWDNLVFVHGAEESKALISSKEPCVIISTSGMCQVGRVRHHLKSLVSNPNATILFAGFSTEGSLASLLKDHKRKTITIDSKEYQIRCASYSLKSLSGHAPFDQLVDYYSSINTKRIILHHGTLTAKMSLKKVLDNRLEQNCNSARVVIANSSMKISL